MNYHQFVSDWEDFFKCDEESGEELNDDQVLNFLIKLCSLEHQEAASNEKVKWTENKDCQRVEVNFGDAGSLIWEIVKEEIKDHRDILPSVVQK